MAEKVAGLPEGHGLNAATGEYGDMLKAGVPDPTKVVRSALQNAASIAALFLTTEAVIADKPEKAPAMPGGGHGWHGWHGLLTVGTTRTPRRPPPSGGGLALSATPIRRVIWR